MWEDVLKRTPDYNRITVETPENVYSQELQMPKKPSQPNYDVERTKDMVMEAYLSMGQKLSQGEVRQIVNMDPKKWKTTLDKIALQSVQQNYRSNPKFAKGAALIEQAHAMATR